MKRQAVLLFAVLGGVVQAQQPVGSVAVQDATVAGNLSVTNGRAVLVSNTTVTAKDHAAEVTLNRGGSVLICPTSGLHITAGASGSESSAGPTPLMLSLDRGAIELRMAATTSDVVMTPDLHFGIQSPGPLDLRLRVTKEGDTCVENRGGGAPVLSVSDPFGESTYDLRPGQHVLFPRGSVKQVVENESSPCGCPATPGVSLADAAISAATPGTKPTSKAAEAQHPFPAAVSAGLAPAPAVPQAPPGVVHAQVATTLSYDAVADQSPATPAAANEVAPPPAAAPEATNSSQPAGSQPTGPPQSPDVTAEAAAPAPHSSDVGHWIGHFFKRLFGRG